MIRPRVPSRDAAKVERPHSLAPQPDRQLTYAAQLLRSGRDVDVVRAALAVLTAAEAPSLRLMLLDTYEYCDEDGVRQLHRVA